MKKRQSFKKEISPEYKAFQETVEKLGKMTKCEEILTIFSPQIVESLRRSIEKMRFRLEEYWKNQHLQVPSGLSNFSPEEKEIVRKNLYSLMVALNERPITQFLRDLVSTYTLLVFNWNNMIAKDPEIDQIVKLLDRLNRMQLLLVETIDLSTRVIGRLKNLLEYSPPSFQLAQHYLSVLQKEIESFQKNKRTNKKKKK